MGEPTRLFLANDLRVPIDVVNEARIECTRSSALNPKMSRTCYPVHFFQTPGSRPRFSTHGVASSVVSLGGRENVKVRA